MTIHLVLLRNIGLRLTEYADHRLERRGLRTFDVITQLKRVLAPATTPPPTQDADKGAHA